MICEYYLSGFVVTFTMRWLAECGAQIKMWSTRCTLFEYYPATWAMFCCRQPMQIPNDVGSVLERLQSCKHRWSVERPFEGYTASKAAIDSVPCVWRSLCGLQSERGKLCAIVEKQSRYIVSR